MRRDVIYLMFIILLLSACQPERVQVAPTAIPFPTMTPGQMLVGMLTPVNVLSDQSGGLSNPATAVALVNQPTATPDYTRCPSPAEDVEAAENPASLDAAGNAILRFLSEGGDIDALEDILLNQWDVFDEGYIINDVDLTGEGSPEILVGYTAPGGTGTLLIAGCRDAGYVPHYQAIADDPVPPQIISLSDINASSSNEAVFALRQCQNEACEFESRIITWSQPDGRFINLLEDPVLSLNIPEMRDMDDDGVQELVLRQDNRGTAATGPLRTGLNIYDWNGAVYTLSIRQPDPPRYYIQVVQEGDRAFSRQEIERAAQIYEVALSGTDLRYWFNDGPQTVDSYLLYRLVLAYAFIGDERLQDIVLGLNTDFPVDDTTTLEDQPVYVEMAYAFLNAYQETGSLNNACETVLAIVEDRPEALDLMNRYGNRSPTYTALDLCPY